MVCLPVYSRITEDEIDSMHEIVLTAVENCLRKKG
jgi:hypothetical protein